jgi:hypothetical protein
MTIDSDVHNEQNYVSVGISEIGPSELAQQSEAGVIAKCHIYQRVTSPS